MGWLRNRLQKDHEYLQLQKLARKEDTVVDPADFPEVDFPVICMKCRYELRGLRDGPCPECGEKFTRGRLLVIEYFIEEGQRFGRCSSRAKLGLVLLVGAEFAFIIGLGLLGPRILQLIDNPYQAMIKPAIYACACLLIAAFSTIVIVLGLTQLRNREKSQMVQDAILNQHKNAQHPQSH